MKKIFLCLLILFPTLIEAGTQYLVDYPLMTANGLERRNSKMTMTSGGDVAILYCENRAVDIWWVASMSEMDGIWDYDTVKTSTTNNDPWSAILSLADSSIVIINHPSTVELLLAKWSGATYARTLTDTVIYTGYGGVSGSPNGAFMFFGGGKILLYHREETGATDSMFLVLSDGALTQTTGWVRLDSGLSLGTSVSAPFPWSGGTKGGLALGNINRSFYWADTAGGIDTLSASFITYTGNLASSFNIVQVSDSNGLLANQLSASAGTDHLYSKRFKVSAVGAGGGSFVNIDSVKIEDAANCPDGFHWYPYYMVSPSGDTVILASLYWANPANTDSADIVYRISTDGGATFGSRIIWVPAVDGKKRANLQAPPDIYQVGDYLLFGIAWQDSIATNDTVRVFIDSLEVIGISNVIVGIDSTTDEIIAEHTYAGFSDVDTVWMFYDTDNDIAGANSVADATLLGSPDTTTATGLTPSTKYWIWSVISYGIASRDTSDADTIRTTALAVPSPVTGLAMDSISNDYLAQPNENDLYALKSTAPAEAGWDSIIYVWSIVAYQDSTQTTNRKSRLYPGASTKDSTNYIGTITEPATVYISAWVWDAVNGYSPRAQATRSYGASDITPPDIHTVANIIAILNIDPDSISLYIGSVTAADYDTTIIRWDTAAIPDTVTAGNALYNGANKEDTTFTFLLNAISQPDWVYITVFAGDEVPNWNAGKTDSVFFPATEGGVAQRSKMYEYLMGLQGE